MTGREPMGPAPTGRRSLPAGVAPPAEVLPRYEQVKQLIRARVASGAWRPGDQIPSEAEFVQELGFSRMTVNRALRELSEDGMLSRLQGVGTFVAAPKISSSLLEVHNIADDIAERGRDHSSRVVVLEAVPADRRSAGQLSLAAGSTVFHSVVVHRENQVPIQLEDRYVNPLAAPDYLAQDFTRRTPTSYLLEAARLSGVEHVVEAVLGAAGECALLEIPASEPCLLIRRRTWSGERAVTSARLLHPGSRNRLEGRCRQAPDRGRGER